MYGNLNFGFSQGCGVDAEFADSDSHLGDFVKIDFSFVGIVGYKSNWNFFNII